MDFVFSDDFLRRNEQFFGYLAILFVIILAISFSLHVKSQIKPEDESDQFDLIPHNEIKPI